MEQQEITNFYFSYTEAEYKALCNATCEAIWLRRIIVDMGEKKEGLIVIKCDN